MTLMGEDRKQVVSTLALESIAGSLLPVYSFRVNLEIDLGELSPLP